MIGLGSRRRGLGETCLIRNARSDRLTSTLTHRRLKLPPPLSLLSEYALSCLGLSPMAPMVSGSPQRGCALPRLAAMPRG